jgi:hypothetical protein
LAERSVAVIAARVIGNQSVALEDPDAFGRGKLAQRAADAIVWDRVIVEIESGVGGLADPHLDALVSIEAVGGQREQAWALLGKDILDGAGGVLRTGAPACGGGAPLGGPRCSICTISGT